jgi:hypothetical protein
MIHSETGMELSKDEFLNILIESLILIERHGEEDEKNMSELKRKFTKQTIMLNLA